MDARYISGNNSNLIKNKVYAVTFHPAIGEEAAYKYSVINEAGGELMINPSAPQWLIMTPIVEQPKNTSALDTQEGGDHYKKMGIYQPWEVLVKGWLTPEEAKGFMKGTVCSYLAREADKGGREDIKKAHHTLGIYLELTESE